MTPFKTHATYTILRHLPQFIQRHMTTRIHPYPPKSIVSDLSTIRHLVATSLTSSLPLGKQLHHVLHQLQQYPPHLPNRFNRANRNHHLSFHLFINKPEFIVDLTTTKVPNPKLSPISSRTQTLTPLTTNMVKRSRLRWMMPRLESMERRGRRKLPQTTLYNVSRLDPPLNGVIIIRVGLGFLAIAICHLVLLILRIWQIH